MAGLVFMLINQVIYHGGPDYSRLPPAFVAITVTQSTGFDASTYLFELFFVQLTVCFQ
jgi:hypothetical protein